MPHACAFIWISQSCSALTLAWWLSVWSVDVLTIMTLFSIDRSKCVDCRDPRLSVEWGQVRLSIWRRRHGNSRRRIDDVCVACVNGRTRRVSCLRRHCLTEVMSFVLKQISLHTAEYVQTSKKWQCAQISRYLVLSRDWPTSTSRSCRMAPAKEVMRLQGFAAS